MAAPVFSNYGCNRASRPWLRYFLAVGVILLWIVLPGFAGAAPELQAIFTNGPVSNRLNLVLLSEGYTSNQLAKFQVDASNVVESLFSIEPFREYRPYCNAFALAVASRESGSDHPQYGQFRDTYFNSSYDASYDYILSIPPNGRDSDYSHGRGKVDALVRSLLPECDLPILVVNDVVNGGSGGALSITSMGVSMPELVAHESGHTLANLGDEYGNLYNQDFSNSSSAEAPNITQETRPELIKWRKWIAPGTPLPTPQTVQYADAVGLFQGANYRASGWYRPKFECRMRNINVPFCEVCSEALVKAISRKVRLIDQFTPAGKVLVVTNVQPVTFSIAPLQPQSHALSVQWYLNNSVVAGATNHQWDILPETLTNGTYTVKAQVRDLTPLVRHDPGNVLAASVVWTVKVDVRFPLVLSVEGPGRVWPDYGGQWLERGRTYAATALPGAGCVFDGWTGDVTNSSAKMSFVMGSNLVLRACFRDVTRPVVSVAVPFEGARTSNAVVRVSGRASDNTGVARVRCRINGGEFVEAVGTSNWNALISAVPGTNLIEAVSIDGSGRESAVAARHVFLIAPSPVTIRTNGRGWISPNLDGKVLEIGRAYTILATPATGHVFAGWSGGLTARTRSVSFLMQSNFWLQADFMTNPFPALAGSYCGLFSASNGVEQASSGFIKLNFSAGGGLSGSLILGGQTYVFAGRAWVDGTAQISIPRSGQAPLSLHLQFQSGSDCLRGSVSDGNWRAEVRGYRAGYDGVLEKAPQAGRYTLAFLPGLERPEAPLGAGFASVVVTPGGLVQALGVLADGVPFSQSVLLSRNGEWPVFAKLYEGRGMFFGWARISNGLPSLQGEGWWTKPSLAGGRFAGGFTNRVGLSGSRWQPSNGVPVLNFTNGVVLLTGGTLGTPLTNAVRLQTNNLLVVDDQVNKLELGISLSSGRITGTFTDPLTGSNTLIKGIVLPEANQAQGFFYLGTNVTGAMLLRAE